MKFSIVALGLLWSLSAQAADNLKSKTTYAKAYGETKNAVVVDPAKDLPRYPAVAPKDAIDTWQVKAGFHLELAANEPQVRSPVAICFDERGRMFACEMIDYSEMRDVTPHLGRVSVLQDKDGNGFFESSQIFADDLAWPTGLIWANGGLYVIATPDIWFFKDNDGDGKAEVREKVFTGFGTGLKILNVQGLANSPQWGLDNRIHILAGGGNRGVVTCLKRPDLKGIELGGRDFWFDPRTHEFGLEAGGAQYGMSFDNYGRKFGCSNSDHLQYWVYDDKYANRNPYFQMPPSRQSIAVDGGAAEVFRLSPDEPWRIIRTRWRIAGVVKGTVEGGGRVSGYFTGATGTTIYRGDAYGPEFVNNSFTGDAGGQLVHRKIIRPSEDGVSLVGERPADERGFEFAASKDTWVRVVNFANAPDGCLHVIDMHREVIEHPWSIPDEIKKHVDLNNGNDMGRIFRIVPNTFPNRRGTKVNLAYATIDQLVQTLGHANGWHRDTAARLLYERNDKAAVPLLKELVMADDDANPLAKIHALSVLDGLEALTKEPVFACLKAKDSKLRERAVLLCENLLAKGGSNDEILRKFAPLRIDADQRVRFQVALTAGEFKEPTTFYSGGGITNVLWDILVPREGDMDPLIQAAAFTSSKNHTRLAFGHLSRGRTYEQVDAGLQPVLLDSIRMMAAARPDMTHGVIDFVARSASATAVLQALGEGLRLAGSTIEKADTAKKLDAVFVKAAATAVDAKAAAAARAEAVELLGFAPVMTAAGPLQACLAEGQPDAVQAIAIKTLSGRASAEVAQQLIASWPHYGMKAKESALNALTARDERTLALLEAVRAGAIKAADLSPAQVQGLVNHKDMKVSVQAKNTLASVIPPSREEVVAKFKPALAMKGDSTRGQQQYMLRCLACHRAEGTGLEVGPDLITVKTKGRDGILSAILEPHKEVAAQFIAYVVNTKDGQTLSGIVTRDDASSMTLKMMGGAEVTLPRNQIKGSSSSGQSLMPEGLETGMTVQEMADLLEFIETLN